MLIAERGVNSLTMGDDFTPVDQFGRSLQGCPSQGLADSF